MTGILKINALDNLGIFENFNWPVTTPDLAFKKINLVYGYNGSGKTTLTNILGLFSEDMADEQRNELIAALKANPDKAETTHIEWDGKQLKSFQTKKKIFVFNSAFVTSHVYDGSVSNLKPFKAGVVTKEQLSNPDIKNLSDLIKSQEDELEEIKKERGVLAVLATTIRLELSKQWNQSIQGSRMPNNLNLENCPAGAPSEAEDKLKDSLDDWFRKYKISSDQASLLQDSQNLYNAVVHPLFEIPALEMTLNKVVPQAARAKIKQKIDEFRLVPLKHSSHQNWFEDGVKLLKASEETSVCPLCDTKIEDLVSLLQSYDAYFNDELASLQREVEALSELVSKMQEWVETSKAAVVTIGSLIKSYNFSEKVQEEQKEALNYFLQATILETLKKIAALVKSKKENLDIGFSPEDIAAVETLFSEIKNHNAQIDAYNALKAALTLEIESNIFDPSSAKEICKKLFWKKFDIQGKPIANRYRELKGHARPEHQGGIEYWWALDKRANSLLPEIVASKKSLSELIAKLQKESAYINQFLALLCVTNFTVNADEQQDGLGITYKNGSKKKGVKHSLSEGEKTALAFAYFLSKYKYEMIDNQDVNEGDCVIVLDDPVSSLDENRLYSTALVIKDYLIPRESSGTWHGCKQMFILSHNLIFLQFMGNCLGYMKDARNDLYIEKGHISKLPNAFGSYQTSYFYKLSKIQAYAKGTVKYDEIKDSLPNHIRIVLEAFLSFKLARLEGNKSPLPMLGQLITNFSNVSEASFKSGHGIKDKAALLHTLNHINQKVNPESHGTPQDIMQFEYIPAAELKEIAEKTISVIGFLDQIHFKNVLELIK